jgi:hypothetical protein
LGQNGTATNGGAFGRPGTMDLPDHHQYPDIEAAINQLMTELNDFDRYFKETGVTAIHGGFGPMDYNEWVIWHNKHFTHHLRQFNLI